MFPRGAGFYLNVPAFLAVVAVYLCWVRTCWWVDRDARQLKLPTPLWNAVLLGSGFLGLLVVWLFPPSMFLLSFAVLLLFYLGPTLVYVRVRNEGLEPERQVMTLMHLRDLGSRLLAAKESPSGGRRRRGNSYPLFGQERRRPRRRPQSRAPRSGFARLSSRPEDGPRSASNNARPTSIWNRPRRK